MQSLPIMTQAAFVATKHAPTDAEWTELVQVFAEEQRDAPARETCTLYAESFLIEQRADGLHYVHAWWYSPVGYPEIEKAEEVLFKWRQEWV